MSHSLWFIKHDRRMIDFWPSLSSVGVVWCVWFALPKENLVTMRNHHLFEIINTNWKIQIFQNEKYTFSLHRACPVPWTQRTNRLKLPVSTLRAVWTTNRPLFLALFWLLAGRNTRTWTYFYRDIDLNTVCHDICAKETYKCLMICDPTDSECISECFRDDATCLESKHLDINVILYSLYYNNRLYYKGHICVVHNCIKVAPAISIVPMVVRTAKTPFANAR